MCTGAEPGLPGNPAQSAVAPRDPDRAAELLEEVRALDAATHGRAELWIGAEPTFTLRQSQDPEWLNQAEGGQHVIEMIATVEMPQRHQFQHDAEQQRRAERHQDAEDEIPAPGHERRREIGAHHVERSMRKIDEIHDAEDECQTGCEQKQQQTELQPVQELFDDKQHRRVSQFSASNVTLSYFQAS